MTASRFPGRVASGVLLVMALTLAACSTQPSSSMSSPAPAPAAAPFVSATSVLLTATLSGTAEVPPNDSAGAGKLDAVFDKSSNVLKWNVTYSGLSGPATMAHFHGPAMPGVAAGVIVPFSAPASPIVGQATLTAPQAADLLDGKWYVNVHTAAHPAGEIRGQVLVDH